MSFLSTLSLRRATILRQNQRQKPPIFYPRSPCGERLREPENTHSRQLFYPRSPCGERLFGCKIAKNGITFSIHALLAESDPRPEKSGRGRPIFLSTLSLRRATVPQPWVVVKSHFSIHALLAESDIRKTQRPYVRDSFLSTLSLRRATEEKLQTNTTRTFSIHALLAESDRPW